MDVSDTFTKEEFDDTFRILEEFAKEMMENN